MNALLTRRQILHSATLAALASLIPRELSGAESVRTISANRVLILLEFEGGNDGINTIVPFADPVYATKRPAALQLTPNNTDPASEVLPFDPSVTLTNGSVPFTSGTQAAGFVKPGFGIHAALVKLMPLWQNGEMAIVQGVGYPNHNRSHFRGINIWSTAQTDDQPLAFTGWVGRMLKAEGTLGGNTDGIVQNRFRNNAVNAPGLRILSFSTPNTFLSQTADILAPTSGQITAAAANPGLSLLLAQQQVAAGARADLNTAVGTPPTFTTVFPTTDLGKQALFTAQCIAGGLACPFYKLKIGGFDTHTNQKAAHAKLLTDVGNAVRALRDALIEKGLWDRVLIMTFSEFGRRLEMNGSNGTDHGTTAPHFLFGGKVKGGFYGTYPSLSSLDSRGDLLFNVDFRQLYATCGKWLGISDANIAASLPNRVGQPAFTALDAVTLV